MSVLSRKRPFNLQYMGGICEEGGVVKEALPFCFPNGEFSHLDVSVDEGGHLYDKYYVDERGNRHDSDNTAREYRAEIERRWGAVGPTLADLLLQAEDDDSFDIIVAVFVDRTAEQIEDVKIVVASVDTDYWSGGLKNEVFHLSATKTQIMGQLAHPPNLQSIAPDNYSEGAAGQ